MLWDRGAFRCLQLIQFLSYSLLIIALSQTYCSLQKGRINAEEHQERVKGAKAAFKATKMLYRNSIRHMHNCICAFDNIDSVDIGAKEYDAMLNGAIPDILHLVDGLE